MTPDPTAAFAALVQGPDADIPLDFGALLIAAHGDPAIDIGSEQSRLDVLASECTDPTLDGLCRYLFGDLGFHGRGADYTDPRSSFLPDVITRRTGLPIALAVLTIEVGRRLGIALHGVAMPGHYVVGVPGEPFFIDAFDGGRTLEISDCERIYREIAGDEIPFDSAVLAPATHRATLARMLANLKQVYLERGDVNGATWVLRLRSAIPDSPPDDQAQLAALLAGQGQARAAARELERLADRLPAARADRARHRAALLRASLN